MTEVEKSAHRDAYRIGILGAILSATGILTSGPLAVLVVALVRPQPLWNGPVSPVSKETGDSPGRTHLHVNRCGSRNFQLCDTDDVHSGHLLAP